FNGRTRASSAITASVSATQARIDSVYRDNGPGQLCVDPCLFVNILGRPFPGLVEKGLVRNTNTCALVFILLGFARAKADFYICLLLHATKKWEQNERDRQTCRALVKQKMG